MARSSEQKIKFCQSSDNSNIAYAEVGDGPPLIKASNWLSHLEFDWKTPVWRSWIREFSRYNRFIRYDQRGCGLSDWNVDEFTVDAWVRDLEAVVDQLGLEEFPLLGISQGGPIAIAYTYKHPEKVSKLILYGSYARGVSNRNLTEELKKEYELFLDLMEVGWGKDNPAFRQVFTSLFVPEATREQSQWFNELQRVSTSPENAVEIVKGFYDIDVRDMARELDVPTIVLHAKGDLRIPFSEGRMLASLIPDAQFVPLESKNHLLLRDEPAWPVFLSEVREFLGIGDPASGTRKTKLFKNTDFERVGDLFTRAMNLEQTERKAFLRKLSTEDPKVHREVESLIATAENSGITNEVGKIVNEAIAPFLKTNEMSESDTVGHYRIVDKLGEGGMGLIYRAVDTKLEREIALKFLPAYQSDDELLKSRFAQEAKAAASLEHPNICTIYEVGVSEMGVPFIAMPLYRGETVKQKIRNGNLTIAEIIDYALQAVRGLGVAHEAGIIHRDIKPANLMITDQGQLKILDFGVAKVESVNQTQSGMILGTLAYMSPEQASAEKVDRRTDLWAIGVVVYEMLTGKQPFIGERTPETISAILHKESEQIADIVPGVSNKLVFIVERLLRKDPADRYQSTSELEDDLNALEAK